MSDDTATRGDLDTHVEEDDLLAEGAAGVEAATGIGGGALLSSVAEHLYWAGRYLERAESTVRLVRSHTELFVDLPRSAGLGWAPLLAVTGTRTVFDDGYDKVVEDDVVHFLLAERTNQGSVVASIDQARENLRVTRGMIPQRMWEVLNETSQWVRSTATAGSARHARVMWTEDVIRRFHTLTGIVAVAMSRDLAYAFLELGRLIERADMTTRVLDVQAGILMGSGSQGLAPFTDLTWGAMLRTLGAEQAYRRQMGGVVSARKAVRFLLRDLAFPRSVEHCMLEISRWLLELPYQEGPRAAATTTSMLLDQILIDDLDLNGLHEFVDQVQLGLGDLHVQLEAAYFPARPDGSTT
ncbi:MAG TPA: alpha-E domain-containing protein [Acidimicrobiales bacterium]